MQRKSSQYIDQLLMKAAQIYAQLESPENKPGLFRKHIKKSPKNEYGLARVSLWAHSYANASPKQDDKDAVNAIVNLINERLTEKLEAFKKSLKGKSAISKEGKSKYVVLGEASGPSKDAERAFIKMLEDEPDKHHETRLLIAVSKQCSEVLPADQCPMFAQTYIQFGQNKSRYQEIFEAPAAQKELKP